MGIIGFRHAPANDNLTAVQRFIFDDLNARREPRSRSELDAIRQILKGLTFAAVQRRPEALRHWRYGFLSLDQHCRLDRAFYEIEKMTPAERAAELRKLIQGAEQMQELVQMLRKSAPGRTEGKP